MSDAERLRRLQHELRTPLAVLQQVAERISDPALADIVKRNVQTMRNVLDAARAEPKGRDAT
jgi:signal transduction histidine kinase